MTFASPWLLLGLALAIPVLIAFLMKRRRTVLRVPSTLLWRGASLKRIRNRKIRHLTKLLALLACIVGVAALALAAGAPRSDDAGETVAFVVDVSASMGRAEAADGTPPIDQARRYLSRMLWTRDAQDRYIIIAAGERPRRLAGPTSNATLLDRALDGLEPERGAADMGAALELAAGMLAGQHLPQVIVLHDGGDGIGGEARFGRAAPDGPPLFERRFTTAADEAGESHNVGLVSFAARRPSDAEHDDVREILLAVATSSTEERRVAVTIDAFGATLAERELEVPSDGEAELRFRVRTPAQELTARIVPRDDRPDVLDCDDEATLTMGAVVPPRVVLVTPADAPDGETFFVTEALRAAGVREVLQVRPDEAHTRATARDVVVVLSQAPTQQPPAPILYLGTQASASSLPVSGQRELVAADGAGEGAAGGEGNNPTRLHSVASHHPLLRGVGLDGVTIHRALAADAPEGGRALVELEGGPIVLAGGDGADGWVYLGVDPTRSDLVLRVAFPVLITNSLALLGGATQVSVAPTVARTEVALRSGTELDNATEAPTLSLSLPRTPAIWLALLGVMLLGVEVLAWRKGWTR